MDTVNWKNSVNVLEKNCNNNLVTIFTFFFVILYIYFVITVLTMFYNVYVPFVSVDVFVIAVITMLMFHMLL